MPCTTAMTTEVRAGSSATTATVVTLARCKRTAKPTKHAAPASTSKAGTGVSGPASDACSSPRDLATARPPAVTTSSDVRTAPATIGRRSAPDPHHVYNVKTTMASIDGSSSCHECATTEAPAQETTTPQTEPGLASTSLAHAVSATAERSEFWNPRAWKFAKAKFSKAREAAAAPAQTLAQLESPARAPSANAVCAVASASMADRSRLATEVTVRSPRIPVTSVLAPVDDHTA